MTREPTFYICVVFALAVSVVDAFTGTFGVNYGRISDNLPPPETVAILLKAARIKNIRIYDADPQVLKAIKGSGIEIIVELGNEFLIDISVYPKKAVDWIKERGTTFTFPVLESKESR